jgi:hypothetical protein
MPVLASLVKHGCYGRLVGPEHSIAESCYAMLLTGQPPEKTGNWLMADFDPRTYTMSPERRREFGGQPLFLPRDPRFRVATFDVPQLPLVAGLNGVQVLWWGAHSAAVPAISSPAELYAELIARHGKHPAGVGNDCACLDNAAEVADLLRRLHEGLERRAAITGDLLRRERWNLFFTSLGETHAAGHVYWPHPACPQTLRAAGDAQALRTIYRRADRVLGAMIEAAGPDAHCLVFSLEGMRDNTEDLGSMVFLPEYLFRYCFPGWVGLDFSNPNHPPSPEAQAGIQNWVMELWHRRHRTRPLADLFRRRLPVSWALRLCRWLRMSPPLTHPAMPTFWGWQPSTWYQDYWPYMKAFALASSSDGDIRLNVKGRESHGLVAPRHYERTCAEISAWLHELRDPASGRPVVAKVIRTRPAPLGGAGKPHEADLIVKWTAHLGNEIDSPRFGRLGPAPYHRAGAHTRDGFVCAAGPGIPAGAALPVGTLLDVAPTILHLMGAPIPTELPGRPLLKVADIRRAA